MRTDPRARRPPARAAGRGRASRGVARVVTVALIVLGVATAATAATAAATAPTAVPHPPEVRPGAADRDGLLAWVDPVIEVTGEPGATAVVDLALDDGTDTALDVSLSVHATSVDPDTGPQVGGATDAITFSEDRIHLEPGARVLLRGVATVADAPRLLTVRAFVVGAETTTTVDAYVLVGAAAEPVLDVTTSVRGRRVEVTVANRSPGPTVARVAVDVRRWVGRAERLEVTDLIVGGEGTRTVALDATTGLGPLRVGAVAASGEASATDTAVVWNRRAVLLTVTALLLAATLLALLIARRR